MWRRRRRGSYSFFIAALALFLAYDFGATAVMMEAVPVQGQVTLTRTADRDYKVYRGTEEQFRLTGAGFENWFSPPSIPGVVSERDIQQRLRARPVVRLEVNRDDLLKARRNRGYIIAAAGIAIGSEVLVSSAETRIKYGLYALGLGIVGLLALGRAVNRVADRFTDPGGTIGGLSHGDRM